MSSFGISPEVVGVGVRVHHQDDIGDGNDDDDDDDEATVVGVSSTLDAGDKTHISSSSESNTNTSSSLYIYTSYLGRNRSTASYTTECTNDTTRISNTTRRQTTKENINFLLFIKILMKIIREKDLNLFRKAQTIIRDYKQRKQRGEIESFVEGICSPLKDNVGLQYWNQAQELLHSHNNNNNKMTSIISLKPSEIMTTTESSTLQSATRIPISFVCHRGLEEASLIHKSKMSTFESIVTTTNNNNIGDNKEIRTRKKRLWMIISIFMQYLERKHIRLYLKAKSLVNECVEIHRCSKYEEKYNRTSNKSSLSASIQSCLKTEIGVDHWRRAENYVAKALLKHYNDNSNKGKNNALGSVEIINHSTTVVKKRQRASSDEIYNNDTKDYVFESR